jgi:hypothetical protein
MSAPATGSAAAGPAAVAAAPLDGLSWGPLPSWERLRARVGLMPGLYRPGSAGCLVCRGPTTPGYTRCYQCAQHAALAGGLLADAVVPISCAVRGTAFARDLWRYKSWPDTDVAVRASLLALLLVFLRDHGGCVWRSAGMSSADRLVIVPSGCGRSGRHPLERMVTPYLRLPSARLLLRPGEQGRDLNRWRFTVSGPVAGANVLLLDDTWVSGGSVQSAAAALKLAGAKRVAAVLLGRHVNTADSRSARFAAALSRYDSAKCAICGNL